MAIATVGFQGSVNATQFARLLRHHDEVGYKHGVTSGLVVTAGVGTRTVSISGGTAVLPGLVIDVDAIASLTFAANGGSSNRTDYVVLEANWVTSTCQVVVVQGTSATPPALTQVEGSLWQMPLARVTLTPGVTTLSGTAVSVAKPIPRMSRRFSFESGLAGSVILNNGSYTTLATLSVSDPGWPYRLRVVGAARVNAGTGFANLQSVVRQVSAGVVSAGSTRIALGSSPRLDLGGAMPVHCNGLSDVLGGDVAVTLEINLSSATTTTTVSTGSTMNHFEIEQIPA